MGSVPPILGSSVMSGSSGLGREPGGSTGLGQFTHTQNVALPLRDGNHTARIEQVENVARLDALVVSRQRHQMALDVALDCPSGIEIFATSLFGHPELL